MMMMIFYQCACVYYVLLLNKELRYARVRMHMLCSVVLCGTQKEKERQGLAATITEMSNPYNRFRLCAHASTKQLPSRLFTDPDE